MNSTGLLSQRRLNGPSALHSARYGFWMESGFVRPLRQVQVGSIEAKNPVPSSVVGLLSARGPVTVVRLVVTVVVSPLDRVSFRRTWANVCEKLLKGLRPLQAHRNSSASVVHEVTVFGISASFLNACPNGIRGTLTETVRQAIGLGRFVMQTATASLTTILQVTNKYRRVISTVTSAVNMTAFAAGIRPGHNQTAEPNPLVFSRASFAHLDILQRYSHGYQL